MARNLKVSRAAVAGGVAALGVTALASGMLITPAQATDNNSSQTPNANGQLGPMGDHGHGMRGHDMMSQYGERVSSERTVKQSDGTVVVIRDVKGTVTAVDANSIIVATADSKNYTYVTDASTTVDREHASATIADVVVGDIARISGTVAGSTATATEIHAETAATEAAEQATRDAAPTTDPTNGTAPTAPDNDGDGPQAGAPDNDGDGPQAGDMGRGMGHGGGHGHGMMGDNDGDGPQAGGPDMGGRGMGGPGHSMDAAARGELISDISVFQQTDGTFITVEEFAGVVSASSDTSVTLDLADGTSASYDITGATINRDRATATAADIAVGDHVRVEGTLNGSTLTVKNVDAISASAWASGPQGPLQDGNTPLPSASSTTTSFSTSSVLKTKKTAHAVAKAAKSAKTKKSKAHKVKSTSSQKKSHKSSKKISA
jgi:hypothetical protein